MQDIIDGLNQLVCANIDWSVGAGPVWLLATCVVVAAASVAVLLSNSK